MTSLYNTIVSPETNKEVKIDSKDARKIILNYLYEFLNNKCKNIKKDTCIKTPECKWLVSKGCLEEKVSHNTVNIDNIFEKNPCTNLKENPTKSLRCEDRIDCEWIMNKGCKKKPQIPMELLQPYNKKNLESEGLDELLDEIEIIVISGIDNDKLLKECSFNGNNSLFTNTELNSLIKKKKILKISVNDDPDVDYSKSSPPINNELDKFGSTNEKKFLTDEMTDFNSEYFFSNQTYRIRFINLILIVIKKYLAILREKTGLLKDDIDIIFKGGIIIRFFLKELIRDFGNETEDYLYNIINDYIKIGDFDFELVSNPEKISPELLNKINIISQMIVLSIRNYLSENKHYYFELFNYNKNYQQKILKKTVDKLNQKCQQVSEDNFYHGITIDYIEFDGDCIDNTQKKFQKELSDTELLTLSKYKGKEELNNSDILTSEETKITTCRTDFGIIKNMKDEVNTRESDSMYFISTKNLLTYYNIPNNLIKNLVIPNKLDGNRLYATYNPNISFIGGDNLTRQFQLNRIKYNYIVYFKKKLSNGEILYLKDNMPGEILDLSHALHNDIRKLKSHILPYSENDYFRQFNFLNYNIKFMTYSMKGLTKDLKLILFDEQGYTPWKDAKYIKRLYRLLFLVIFYYFSEMSNHEKYITYSEKLRNLKKMINLINKNFDNSYDFKFKINLLDGLKNDFETVYLKSLNSVNKDLYTQFKNATIKIFKKLYIIFYLEQKLNKQKELSIKYLNSDFILN